MSQLSRTSEENIEMPQLSTVSEVKCDPGTGSITPPALSPTMIDWGEKRELFQEPYPLNSGKASCSSMYPHEDAEPNYNPTEPREVAQPLKKISRTFG